MRRVEAARAREVLAASPPFRALPARRLARLLAASRLEQYEPDQVIVREGTLGDAFYVVIQGEVAVQVSHPTGDVTRLATLGPGDYFGEMALMSGRPRVADVLATIPTEVLAVPGAVFDTHLLGDARFKARLTQESHERETQLFRQRVARTLQGVPLFASLRWEELLRIASSAHVATVPKGTIVCRQGDPASALYVVLSGEAEVRAVTAAGERGLTTLTTGGSFGEMSLLTGAPLPATLETLVDTSLLTLDKTHCAGLLDHAPIARSMSHILGERLREEAPVGLLERTGVGGAVVTVASTEPGLGKTTLAVNLAASLAQHVGSVVLVDLDPERAASRYLGLSDSDLGLAGDEPDLSRLPRVADGLAVLPLRLARGNAGRARLSRTLDALRRLYRFVVVDTTVRAGEPPAHAWRQSDSVLFLTRGTAEPPEEVGRAEALLVYVPDAVETTPPVVGGRVFRLPSSPEAGRRFSRQGRPFVLAEPRGFLSRAIGRIARYLTRQQVGLVLAGGAAWGPSEAGVLAGLEERGADIDLIAATGIGGLLGAAYAAGLPVQALERLALAF